MRHPTAAVLRRLLDDPAGVADPDREHIAGCPQCLGDLATVRRDAALAGSAHAFGPGTAAAATSQGSTTAGLPAGARGPARSPGGGRVPGILRRPAVAALAVAFTVSGAGVAAAAGWMEIFQTEEVAPLGLSTADLRALPDLEAYGDLEVSGDGDVMDRVPDAAAAAAATGLDVPKVATLPRGVSGEPVYQVGDKVSATFTFSADEAADAAAANGDTLPPPPPGVDGSEVRLVAGPGVAAIWSKPSGPPALIVGRAVAPTASSSGVRFETLRDYVLSLPSLPDDVAAQLRAFNADGSTLPLPVPADEVRTSSAQVDGIPATVLATRDQTVAAVVWVDDGVVTAVAGSLDTDEVLSVARELD